MKTTNKKDTYRFYLRVLMKKTSTLIREDELIEHTTTPDQAIDIMKAIFKAFTLCNTDKIVYNVRVIDSSNNSSTIC